MRERQITSKTNPRRHYIKTCQNAHTTDPKTMRVRQKRMQNLSKSICVRSKTHIKLIVLNTRGHCIKNPSKMPMKPMETRYAQTLYETPIENVHKTDQNRYTRTLYPKSVKNAHNTDQNRYASVKNAQKNDEK